MKAVLRLLLLAALPLVCAETGPLETGTMGHPLIQVRLMDRSGQIRTARFLLDTGAEVTILDRRLVAAFARPDANTATLVGSTGESEEVRMVRIRSLDLGPAVLTEVLAVEADLSGNLGAMEDGPLEGIIGMNVLRGRTFDLDFAAGRITWGAPRPPELHEEKLSWTRGGLPQVALVLPKGKAWVICDTGFTRFADLLRKDTERLPIGEGLRPGASLGVTGALMGDTWFTLQGDVTLGAKRWRNPEIGVMAGGDQGLLGMGAFQPRVWFDLAKGRVGLPVTPEGDLRWTPFLRCPLAVGWTGEGDRRHLTVFAVKPGSAMEKAGVRKGDRVLAIGDLTGPRLSVRTLREKLAAGPARQVVLERGGERITVEVAEELPAR